MIVEMVMTRAMVLGMAAAVLGSELPRAVHPYQERIVALTARLGDADSARVFRVSVQSALELR